MQNFERLLPLLLAICVVVLLARLVFIGLFVRYRSLFCFLAILGSELFLLLLIPENRSWYARVYLVCQLSNLLVAFAVVREIFSLSLMDRPALAAFGKKVVVLALAISALLAALTLFLDNTVLPGQYTRLHIVFVVERTGNLVLLLLLLMISVYLTWFPVRLPRNILLYAGGFAVLFLARSLGLLAMNRSPQSYVPGIDAIMLCLEVSCMVFWSWSFRRESEDVATISGHRWNPAEMDRLTQQLDSINTALTRFNQR